jgi:hypothetical protein
MRRARRNAVTLILQAPVTMLVGLLASQRVAAEVSPPSPPLDDVQVASLTGVRSGLVIVVGEADWALPSALAGSGNYVVQVLAPAEHVDGLRQKAMAAGLHGPLSIVQLPDGGRLPHPSRFAELIIAYGRVAPRGQCRRQAATARWRSVEGRAPFHRAGPRGLVAQVVRRQRE